jgi:hypothetical protein
MSQIPNLKYTTAPVAPIDTEIRNLELRDSKTSAMMFWSLIIGNCDLFVIWCL